MAVEHRIIVVNYYGDEVGQHETNSLMTVLANHLPIKGGTISIAQLNSQEINALVDKNVIPDCGEEAVKHAIVFLKDAYRSNDGLSFSLDLINKCQTDLKTRNAVEILTTSNVSIQMLSDYGLTPAFIETIKKVKQYV